MTYRYEVTCSVKLNKYLKYDAYLLDMAREEGRITGPCNIGHSDLDIVWGH